MRFIEPEDDTDAITELSYKVGEDICSLWWRWPEGIQAVYIRKVAAGHSSDLPTSLDGLKLYTREEYKANNGYHERIDLIGQFLYIVYGAKRQDGEMMLIEQHDGVNSIGVSTGRSKIRYSIRHKSGLLRKFKTVNISVTTECEVPSGVLCYVKKQGGYPTSKEDGTQYPFLRDFAPGRNILPAIEVGRDDFVRLFFTDGRKFGQFYELLPE
ncbi:beta-mannanase [Paenibacillus segetis]|uniref:Beta-mannanase n=1 Tax=Paenibacillus segetis TaxID=1325360 RepID=A0ABQ1YFX5_9BACL|nr:beta-mannanase [Paenibacillus segetis]GGH23000.1 hypothetical protein GCM10008013_21790 [Paenibacillus segetis]